MYCWKTRELCFCFLLGQDYISLLQLKMFSFHLIFSACNFTFTFVCSSTHNYFQFAMPETSALPSEYVPSSWKNLEVNTCQVLQQCACLCSRNLMIQKYNEHITVWNMNHYTKKQTKINRITRNESGGAKLNNTTVRSNRYLKAHHVV